MCIGCDSQATNASGSKLTLAESKIVRCGEVLIGASDTLAASHFLRHEFARSWEGGETLDEIANGVVRALRVHLKSIDGMRIVNGNPELPGHLLIAKRSEFLLVDASGSIIRIEGSWWAIGSGAPEARGSLWTAQYREHVGSEADLMASDAVKAACALDDGCGPPVRIEWTQL